MNTKSRIELAKQSSETYIQYLLRMSELKRSKVIDYQEYGDCILGDDNVYAADNIRKAWYVVDKITEKIGEEAAPAGLEVLSQKNQLQMERYKIQAEKVELNRLLRQRARFELFYSNVADKIEQMEPPVFKYHGGEIGEVQSEYILTIADIHAGANFVSETNEYSYDICTQRFKNLLDQTVDFVRYKKLSKLKVFLGGDSIQGMLRIKDVKLNETTVVESVVFVSKTVAHFLNQLSEHCEVEFYHAPTSNHTQCRFLGTKANEMPFEDMEYIIGNYIKDSLAINDRVQVFTNFGKHYIEIPFFNGEIKAAGMHGHTVKSLPSAVKNISYQHKQIYHMVLLGHYHAGSEMTVGEIDSSDIEVIVCPSFVGSDHFSDQIEKGAKGSCKIFGIDRKYGRTESFKIILN